MTTADDRRPSDYELRRLAEGIPETMLGRLAVEVVLLRGKLTAATEIHRPVKVAISAGQLRREDGTVVPVEPTYVTCCAYCDNGVWTGRSYPCPTAAALGGAR